MLNLQKVKATKKETEAILVLISNHNKLTAMLKSDKPPSPDLLLKMLKVEVTVGKRRAFMADRLRWAYSKMREHEEAKEVAGWLAR